MTSLKQKENVSQNEATGQSESTAKKKVYNFTDAEGNPKRLKQWYRIPMDEHKQSEYLAGNNVEVGVLNVEGKDYMVYLQFNKEKKMPESCFGVMENGKVVGFADASKVQAAINLQGKTSTFSTTSRDRFVLASYIVNTTPSISREGFIFLLTRLIVRITWLSPSSA